ncbi:hypothetical protein ACFLZU_01840 [Thermodesulfobacteriota bacterium]
MPTKFILVVSILLLCSACSVSVSPIATPTGIINPEDNSLTETHDGVSFTVKLDQLSFGPYQQVDNITSFHVNINNQTESQISFPSSAFLLKDGNGRQYRSITPERVREIVSKDSVYLIPYPYVGYYYLEDQARVAYQNTFSSSLPFYAEYHPQDIFTRALTEEPLLKKSNASGLVYFIADLERTNYAELLVFPDQEASGEPLLKFPFAIKK